MNDLTTTEPRVMPKAQKTILVNEDLYRLFQYMERRYGATFTRQATAAFLDYMTSAPSGPDPFWMEAAIGLEDGSASVGDILLNWAKNELIVAHQQVEARKDWCKSEGLDESEIPVDLTQRHQRADMRVREIEFLLKRDPDPIEAILSRWKEVRPTSAYGETQGRSS